MQNLEINIKQKNRSTNVELLRVLCMFLIVVIHYVYHGLGRTGYYTSFDMHSINDALRYITLEPLWVLALTAVNCYVIFISTWILLALFATMYNSLTWPLFKLKGSDYNGPVFFLSLAIFIYFVNTSFKRGSLLTKAAPYTFGVYLIHDNPMVRRVVWGGNF